MAEPRPPTKWWQTVPGLLTATAALLTALTGFLVALNQLGVFHGTKPPAQSQQTVQQPTPASQSPDPGTGARPGMAGKAWPDAAAVIHTQDGLQTSVRADTLSHIISVQHAFDLTNGQSVPFDNIHTVDVLSADDPNAPQAQARLAITLLNGDKVSGAVCAAYGCEVFGYNAAGRYQASLQSIKRIQFER